MKKLLILAIFVLFATSLTAAPSAKGNFVITMPLIKYLSQEEAMYENANGDGRETVSILAGNFNSGIQYFIINGLAIGGELGYSSFEQGDTTIKSVTIMPMATYYINLNGPILPFIGISYRFVSTDTDTGSGPIESTDTSLGIMGGVAFMLGQNVALHGKFAYYIDGNKDDDGNTLDGKGLGFELGFSFFF